MSYDETYIGRKLDRYGLGILFSANVLGAGSVYILADTGANFGFALLWVFGLTFIADMLMHDMSSRMATRGLPVMAYIREQIGTRLATVFAVAMALVMNLWAIANYAVAGAVLAWFLPISTEVGIIVVALLGVGLLLQSSYNDVEAAITAMLVLVFGAYSALMVGLPVPTADVIAGTIPQLDPSYATAYIAVIGTTIYYPNFLIQSSMRPTKEWTELGKYRRDNLVGILTAVVLSIGMMGVAAIALDAAQMSLAGPAIPVGAHLGEWAIHVFMVAVFAASFTSGTGTMFGSGFAVPQALGHHTTFGDHLFNTVVSLLLIGAALSAIILLNVTALGPVEMAILMPAINGLIFLPIIAGTMYLATRSELPWWQQIATVGVFLILLIGSVLTAQDLLNTIRMWL